KKKKRAHKKSQKEYLVQEDIFLFIQEKDAQSVFRLLVGSGMGVRKRRQSLVKMLRRFYREN
ncbi:hypothetical protein KCA24_26645, partial [Escherichia coli]|nr:hypothetical protein [Escherichia coli]